MVFEESAATESGRDLVEPDASLSQSGVVSSNPGLHSEHPNQDIPPPSS